jgi:hypothetical protein
MASCSAASSTDRQHWLPGRRAWLDCTVQSVPDSTDAGFFRLLRLPAARPDSLGQGADVLIEPVQLGLGDCGAAQYQEQFPVVDVDFPGSAVGFLIAIFGAITSASGLARMRREKPL